jgi:cytochrome c oxidase subunit 2
MITKLLFSNIAYTDAGVPNQIGFQDPATPIFAGIIDLHNEVCFYLVVVLVSVSWILFRTIWLFNVKRSKLFTSEERFWFYWTPKLYNGKQPRSYIIPKRYTHNTILEIVWTITPAIILMLIAIPSFALLYSMDELIDPAMTIKAIGHQWYWTYEYSDYNIDGKESLSIDSYMLPEDSLEEGQLRVLEVDNRIKMPINTHIRMICTSTDVIHSWTIPSFGVKVDALPGRLNQISIFIQREGVYYGQCSELCGVNHGFMPIVVEAVSLDEYINWINTNINK